MIMNYIVTYRDGTQTKRVRVQDTAAVQLQQDRESKPHVMLGKIQIKTSQILSIGPEDAKETGLAMVGTKEHKKRLRQELITSRNNCKQGIQEIVNGKERCSGFVDVDKFTKGLCTCQRAVKMLNGVEPDDYDYLNGESEV